MATKIKSPGRGKSLLAKRAGEIVAQKLANNERFTMKEVMLEAGYAPTSAEHPERLTDQPGFLEVMEAHGISDHRAIKTHGELLQASKIEKFYFDNIVVKVSGKGKKKRKTVLTPISDEEIKRVIESVPGCEVLYINRLRSQIGTIEVIYKAPENLTRKAALELAYKVKGQIKPENHLHAHAHLHRHEYTIPEVKKKAIDDIMKANR